MAEILARWATGPLRLPEARDTMGQIIATPELLPPYVTVTELNQIPGYERMPRNEKLEALIHTTAQGTKDGSPMAVLSPPSDIDRRVLCYGYYGTDEEAVDTLTQNFYQIVERVLHLRDEYSTEFLFCTVLCGGPTLNPKFAEAGLTMAQHLIQEGVRFHSGVVFPPPKRSLLSFIDPATIARTFVNASYPREVLSHIVGVSNSPTELAAGFSKVIDEWVTEIASA